MRRGQSFHCLIQIELVKLHERKINETDELSFNSQNVYKPGNHRYIFVCLAKPVGNLTQQDQYFVERNQSMEPRTTYTARTHREEDDIHKRQNWTQRSLSRGTVWSQSRCKL